MRPIRRFLLALLVGLCPVAAPGQTPAPTTCAGQDLIATLPVGERAALDATLAGIPFAEGNHWLASRHDRKIHVIGTLHLYDPRMESVIVRLEPVIAAADKVFVEATDAELAALQKAIGERPELLFTTGPTLPERLTKEEWAALSQALRERGIPPFIASKFRPWYLSVMLSMPACAMAEMASGSNGLDRLVIDSALAAGKPVKALEPYDTLFRAFDRIAPDDQLDMIRAALPLAAEAEDMLATMVESSFRESHRQIWEFGRARALAIAGDAKPSVEADYALMEAVLIDERNLAWTEQLLADDAPLAVVAVGAGHLSGETGLLNLLAAAGFTLQRLEF